jgi:uncharacterized protein YbaA (DUF1428 family)
MPQYVDGFVLPMPKANVAAYKAIAEKACKIFLEHGALEYRECVAEDMNASFCLSFPAGINAKPDETVVFAWIVYESRAHRDEVNQKAMSDPRLTEDMNNDDMPFDVKRMLYGGFEMLVAS